MPRFRRLAPFMLAVLAALTGGFQMSTPDPEVRSYLPFVEATVAELLAHQTARIGGWDNGTEFVTASLSPARAWTSVGIWRGASYQRIPIPARELDREPTIVDFAAWPMLDKLTAVTGETRYSEMVDAMADEFAYQGFHPDSGLILHGSMFVFDVEKIGLVPTSIWGNPAFKSGGPMPWDRLWAVAPEEMARFCKATYYVLVTRPETMDFNRYGSYSFNDSAGLHVQSFHPMHRGFVSAGARLVFYWAMAFAHTGDAEALGWAEAMTDKWIALQFPETGLLPHFIGAVDKEETGMPPTPYANIGDTLASTTFLDAADELAKRPEGETLAAKVRALGLSALRGLATHGYDAERRVFPTWINPDGTEHTEMTFYCFRTQADKDAALARDPAVADVDVFAGDGFFRSNPKNHTAGARTPKLVAAGAALTRDPVLIERGRFLADEFMREARALDGPKNAEGQWVFPALGDGVRMMLAMHKATGEAEYLDRARELADIAVAGLEAAPTDEYEWWRLPARSGFLEALLDLELALQASE